MDLWIILDIRIFGDSCIVRDSIILGDSGIFRDPWILGDPCRVATQIRILNLRFFPGVFRFFFYFSFLLCFCLSVLSILKFQIIMSLRERWTLYGGHYGKGHKNWIKVISELFNNIISMLLFVDLIWLLWILSYLNMHSSLHFLKFYMS